MRIRIITLLTFLMALGGCSTTSVYVLDQAELIRIKEGQNITAKYDGWLLSDRAVKRVMDVKVKKVNLQ